MADGNDEQLEQAEKDLRLAQNDVDEQVKTIHRLEAQGRDESEAQQRLDTLLERLEAAQQAYKVARRPR